METLTEWIAQHGYLGLFSLLMVGILGLPFPDEPLLLFSGYLIHKGEFHWPAAIGTALAGSACGITLTYLLGYTLGWWFIRRIGPWIHLTDQRLENVRGWFERYGGWTLLLGYFVPGFRHATAYVAGMSRMRYPRFALFAYCGAAVWSTTFLVLGYFSGPAWRDASRWVHHGHLTIAILAAVVAMGVGLVLVIRRRHG